MCCKEIHVNPKKACKVCDMLQFSNEDIETMSADTILTFFYITLSQTFSSVPIVYFEHISICLLGWSMFALLGKNLSNFL